MSQKYPFLDLLDRKLDDAQSRALETRKNAVIAAGAGSGKTQVLATRFSWLVLTGQARADQILTLTFTTKAAAEMYQRIYDTLNFFANHKSCPELSEKEIQLAKEGLADFANAHIQTLDSYCSDIVRQCSNRYGVRPDFTVASSDGQRNIKDLAFKFILQNAENPAVKKIVQPGKLQDFAENEMANAILKFTSLASPDGFFSAKIPNQIAEVTRAINFYFNEKPKSDESFPGGKNLAEIEYEILTLLKDCKITEKHLAYKNFVDKAFSIFDENLSGQNISANDISSLSSDSPESSKKLQNFSEKYSLFRENILNATKLTSGYIQKIRTLVTCIKNNFFPIIDSIFTYINQFDTFVAFYSLMDDLLKQVNTSKRMSGDLSFVDVSQLALKILIENPDIREQEIAAYKKIMIDEFQDNNSKNRDLLYLLSLKPGTKIAIPTEAESESESEKSIYSQIIQKDENGNIIKDCRESEKLFFVGDEKQSIYKFRGAEVSVFNELTSNGENLLIPMTYNYRSSPEMLQAFNLIFDNGKGIFAAYSENEKKLDYEAYYDQKALKFNVKARKEEILPELTAKNVPIHIRFANTNLISTSNEATTNPLEKFVPPEDQEAYFIAKKIKELAGENQNWKDFAILDKSRSHRSQITKYLSLLNIPYQLDQFNNIFEDGIVNDFYNFFRICVYPSDINSYAAYLCSPLAGLSENSVELILSNLVNIDDTDFVFDPFADVNDEIKNDLSPEEYEKYISALEFFKENQSLFLQQKLTSSVNLLWNKKAYKYETMLSNQTNLNAEAFDMIFELARTSENEGKSLAWFIDQLENLKSTFSSEDADLDAKEISYPLEREQAVQIMTIHKSKGLQFHHVFIFGCTGVKAKFDKKMISFDEKFGLSISAENEDDDKSKSNYFSLRQKDLERKKELAEFRRLIYVGITRAIDDVYVVGHWNPDGKSSSEKEANLKLFENYVESVYQKTLDEKTLFNDGAAFDFANLKNVTYAEVGSLGKKQNLDEIRQEKIAAVSKVYENAGEILYENKAIPRGRPSDLEKDSSKNFSSGSTTSGYGGGDNLSEDNLMDANQNDNSEEGRLQADTFTAADFGVLVHSYLEVFVKGLPPEEYQPNAKLFKNLSDAEKEKVKNECIDFTNLFTQTELGKELAEAKTAGRFYRAEWGFKMFWKEILWTGSLDLIYQKADGSYQIVDYKSDNEVNSEKYRSQQECYKVAATKMLGISEDKISCKLWFMKENEVVEL